MTTLFRHALLSLLPVVGLVLALRASAPVAAARLGVSNVSVWCVEAGVTPTVPPYGPNSACSNSSAITDLQTAIDKATNGDTIEIDAEIYRSPGVGYVFKPGQTSLTIVGGFPGGSTAAGWTQYGGPGDTVLAVDQQDSNFCFTIPSGFALTMYNLNLQCGDMRNSGTVVVPTGQLIFGSLYGTISGAYVIDPNAAIDLWAIGPSGSGLRLVLANQATLSGGLVRVEQGNGGSIQIGQASGDQVSIDNLELDDVAAIQGPGQLNINKSFTWNGGTLGPTGTFVLGSGGTASFTGAGGSESLVDATLTLNGPTTDADAATTNLAMNGAATLNNNAAFTFSNDSSVGAGSDLSERVINGSGGSIVKTCCAGVSHVGPSIGGSGTLAVSSGTLSLDGMSGLTNASNVQIAPGTTLAVTGGSYTQRPGGTLSVDIGGMNPPGQFGRLAVQGAAALGGTLAINLVDGFIPANGDRFAVVTCASCGDTFATVNLSPAGAGTLQPNYSSTAVTLTASGFVPTPTPTPTGLRFHVFIPLVPSG